MHLQKLKPIPDRSEVHPEMELDDDSYAEILVGW
jgi:hypothetical protein